MVGGPMVRFAYAGGCLYPPAPGVGGAYGEAGWVVWVPRGV